MLGNTAEALRYSETPEGDLYIQGTGHPALLNTAFPQEKEDPVIQFLISNSSPLTFCTCNFLDKRYGSGWSWDDYHYYFQKEKSPLPIYGNSINFQKKSRKDSIDFYPEYFQNQLTFEFDSTINGPNIFRNWDNNQFSLTHNPNTTFTKKERPFRTDAATITALLADTIGQKNQHL